MIPDPADPLGATARPFTITLPGLVATLVLFAVIAAFARLGFWQLARLDERKAANSAIAARLDAPPIANAAVLSDTAGLYYRSVSVRGMFDDERSIILPGRSLRGLPGIHLITPLVLEGRTDAVLVNRGWVPSADAASVNLADFVTDTAVVVTGLILPFLGPKESLAPMPAGGLADSAFRRIWFAIDEDALRGQFPYSLVPVTLQERGAADATVGRGRYPASLAPPALDEGPHLGYALQWFSFAIVGVIGWIALIRRSRADPYVVPPVAVATLLLLATPIFGHAQLRPLDPLDWRIFGADANVTGAAGFGLLWNQRVPMAGSEGRLIEAGNYSVMLRSGRIAVEVGGTAIWRLDEHTQVEPAAPWVRPSEEGVRQAAGPAHAATALLVSGASWPVDVVVRFGARLPTTGYPSGLERDRTDFFALAGTRYVRGRLDLAMEHGVGINGAVFSKYPQSDMWTYSFSGAWSFGAVRAVATVLGQQDGHSGRVRGNEDQRELRIGGEAGGRRWVSAQLIRGLSRFSPETGIRLSAGFVMH